MADDSAWRTTWIRIRDSFVYWGGRAPRITQNSPVLPEVWERYFRFYWDYFSNSKTDAQDGTVPLILTPHAEAGVAALGKMLHSRGKEFLQKQRGMLFSDRHRELPDAFAPKIAFNVSYIATDLTFEQMATVLVPMTSWWRDKFARLPDQSHGIPDFTELRRELQRDKYRNKGLLPGDSAFPDPKLSGVSMEVLWAVRLFGALCCLRKEQRNAKPGSGDESTLLTVLEKPATRLGALDSFESLIATMPTSKDSRFPADHPLWQITLNRRATPTVAKSAVTVKADAARRVFNVSCAHLAWAVVDSGVDATHPAFLCPKDKSHPRYRELPGEPPYTRVIGAYDFSRLRDEPDLWYSGHSDEPEIPVLEDSKAWEKRRQTNVSKEDRHVWNLLRAARRASINLAMLEEMSGTIDWKEVAGKIEVKYDGKSPNDGVPKSEHGTHVAGILGAAKDGTPKGADGVCPDICLYDLRVFGAQEAGSDDFTDEFTVLCALQFIEHLNRNRKELAVHGVNLSLSIPHDVTSFACGCTPVCLECSRLVENGVVVVVAAGNHGFDEKSVPYSQGGEYRDISISDPGNAQDAITVGATHRDHPHTYGVSYFSGRGPTGDGRRKPDLVAPGEKIEAPIPRGGYGVKDGTSMAAPHVSGAAALLMAQYPELIGNPRRIKQILCDTATDLGRERYFQGHGLLDVLRAMQAV